MRRANQKPNLILNSLDRRGGASPSSALIGGGVLSRNQSEVKGRELRAGAGRGAAGQSLPPRARRDRARTDRARLRSATVRPQPGLLGSGRRLGPRVVQGERVSGRGSGRGTGAAPSAERLPAGWGGRCLGLRGRRCVTAAPSSLTPELECGHPTGVRSAGPRVPPATPLRPRRPTQPGGSPSERAAVSASLSWKTRLASPCLPVPRPPVGSRPGSLWVF